MERVEETELAGGGINRVVRIGDAVHRPSAPWSPAKRELLSVLHGAGLPVPAWRGTDDQGRDVLDFLPGEVGHYPLSEAVRSEAALVSPPGCCGASTTSPYRSSPAIWDGS